MLKSMQTVFKNRKIIFLSFVGVVLFTSGVFVGQLLNKSRALIDPAVDATAASSLSSCANTGVPDFVKITEEDLGLYWKVWQFLKDRYYDQSFNDVDLLYGSIAGMVNSLKDPYTVFFTPEQAENFNKELEGTFEGIGAEIGKKHDQITVISPLDGTPANRAGLRAGDVIFAIDERDTFGMSVHEAVDRIRGPKGSVVVLTIISKGDSKARDVDIKRDKIVVKTVTWKTVGANNDIAYMRIFSFGTGTEQDFKQAAKEILKSKINKLILDLRANPGGFMDTAVEMAGYWIPSTLDIGGESRVIVKESFADGSIKVYKPYSRPKFVDFKTVVLVNEGSASASEIVAGALRDYKKATIVGEQTFGKGSIQDYSSFDNGSALKVTIAEWLTPLGISINKEGIAPDIEVELTREDYNNDLDPQLDKAIKLLE